MRRENSVLFALDDIRRLETARRNDEESARVTAEAEANAIAAAQAQHRLTEAELERVRAERDDARRDRAAQALAADAAHRRVGELTAELVITQHRVAAAAPRVAPPPTRTGGPLLIALSILGVGGLAFFVGTRAGTTTIVPARILPPIVSAPVEAPPIAAPTVAAAPPSAPIAVRRPRQTHRGADKPVAKKVTISDCDPRDPVCGLNLDDDGPKR